MRTRTLLILAAVCGLLILLAGGLKLFQVASDPAEVETLAVGDETLIGDMTVAVTAIDRSADSTVVAVRLSGVPDADAIAGWRLWGDGASTPLEPRRVDGTTCDDSSVPATGALECVLVFASVDTLQSVIYLRAGDQRQWAPD
jgi:VCBS repeat-containing protein